MLNNELNKSKNELRGKFLKMRNELDSKNVKQLSEVISNKIINSLYFRQAENISVYIPSNNEVDIRIVIEKAWELNKNVLAPKTDPILKQINFYKINSWEELKMGNFRISEPIVGKKKPFPIGNIEVILIPGILFDYNGYRIGYGGGYYDRFLTLCNTSLYKVGIAYNFQVIKRLPILDHDYAVDKIVTEKKSVFVEHFNKD